MNKNLLAFIILFIVFFTLFYIACVTVSWTVRNMIDSSIRDNVVFTNSSCTAYGGSPEYAVICFNYMDRINTKMK